MFGLRASFCNAFNQVRRTTINTSVQCKADGKTLAGGVTLFSTPELIAASNATLNGRAQYNQYRSGVGPTNLTHVSLMPVIEIGLKYRF